MKSPRGTNPKVIAALKAIAERNNGLLDPQHVVEEASKKTSPLHSRFTWDDSEAAQEYRLWQARQLIRTTVQFITLDDKPVQVRVFVSLPSDRKPEEEGENEKEDEKPVGYRETFAVMQVKDLRAELLEDAKNEMERFERKFALLSELADVIAEMRRARKSIAQLTQ